MKSLGICHVAAPLLYSDAVGLDFEKHYELFLASVENMLMISLLRHKLRCVFINVKKEPLLKYNVTSVYSYSVLQQHTLQCTISRVIFIAVAGNVGELLMYEVLIRLLY